MRIVLSWGESIIDFVRQLRHYDATSLIPATQPLFASFCIDDIDRVLYTPDILNILGVSEYFFREIEQLLSLIHISEPTRPY